MVMSDIVLFILFLISGISNAIMDKLQFHFHKSIFSKPPFTPEFWDPNKSWVNKWAKGFVKNEKRLWYYLWLYKPKYKERFPYSSTILVFTTDAWHLAQWIMLKSLILAVSLTAPITDVLVYDFIICQTIFSGTFELFFNKVLMKKDER
jgi:disulfide bond formation protein DsbB